ncbi:MAG: CvpA family protein [Burkholderiales bacterium]|nr:CvpA family protein [Sulfuricellaceae bacterium]
MTLFDYAVLLIIGVSILFSVMRGVVREVLALLSWVAAFFVAKTYVGDVLPYLPKLIPTDTLRLLAAFVVLFLGALLLMSLISIAASELIKTLGLGAIDKGLGAFFGFARGFLIVCLLVMLGGLTSLPRQSLWQNAMFSAPLEALVMSGKQWLPDDLSKRIHYE